MTKKIILFLSLSVFSYSFTLSDGFKTALENDMEIKINENNIKNIKLDKEIANSLMKPSIDFSATVQSSKSTENSRTPDKEKSHTKTDEYKITVTQPIFDGFESSNEKQLQDYKYKSALYFYKESQNSLAFDYTQNYINVLKEKDLLTLGKEAIFISEKILKKVDRKLESGYGTQLEYNEAKVQLAESKVNYQTQKINFKDSIEGLKFYVQIEFDSNELIKPVFNHKLPKNLNEAIAKSFEENPSLKVSKLNLDAAKYEVQKTTKNFYPNLDFVSSYQINDTFHNTNIESNEYSVGLQLNYNLYNGGKDSLEKRKALQSVREKQFLIKKTENEIRNEIRLAWNSYKLNKEKNDALKEYLIVKKDVLDSTIKEFDLGLKSLNNLLTMHTEYIEVKQDYIRNTYDLILSKYRILSSIGNLNEVLINEISIPKKEDELPDLFKNIEYSFDEVEYTENESVIPIEDKLFEKNAVLEESFKNKFLSADKNKYTINLALSFSEEDAKKFIEKNKLEEKAFFFSFRYKNPLQKIMMGVYDSKKEAYAEMNKLSKSLLSNKPRVEKIKIKQNLFKKYHFTEYTEITNKTLLKKSEKEQTLSSKDNKKDIERI